MARIIFIGDELSAAAYRLAGASVHSPERGRVARVFSRARQDCELLLIGAEQAGELPEDVLHEALRDSKPLTLIVPDVRRRAGAPDLVAEVDRALGIES